MRALIDRDKNFQVIAETDDRGQTFRLLGSHRPDVILFDLDPAHDTGIETISEIVRNHPGIRIIALSMRCENAIVESAVRAGVIGFICKAEPSDNLTDILKTVAQGGAYLSPRLVGRVMDRLKNGELRSMKVHNVAGLVQFAASAGVIVVAGLTDRGGGQASPHPSDRAGS